MRHPCIIQGRIMFKTSPEEFAALFNEKYPGACRQITAQGVREMTTCGLIGRHYGYIRDDLETIRGILEYEQLRENRPLPPTSEEKQEPPSCKKCNQPLPVEPEGKIGRPRRYCLACQLLRNRNRQRKFRDKRRKQRNEFSLTKAGPSLKQLHCEPGQ